VTGVADLPEPRRVEHPGDEIEPRVLTQASAEPGRELRLHLPEGMDILNGLGEVLRAQGITTAGVRLGGGSFKKFSYYTGVEDPTGYRVATFSPPNFPPLPVTMAIANVMVGIGEEGEAKGHCHAIFLDGEGNKLGGHLIPGECIIGPGGLVAWATGGDTADLKVRHDPETNFPIFHPAEGEGKQ
jgi:predicted DNA-binding protein with PD1-like motif